MTSTDKKAKVRERVARTGENYTTALRRINEALADDPVFGPPLDVQPAEKIMPPPEPAESLARS